MSVSLKSIKEAIREIWFNFPCNVLGFWDVKKVCKIITNQLGCLGNKMQSCSRLRDFAIFRLPRLQSLMVSSSLGHSYLVKFLWCNLMKNRTKNCSLIRILVKIRPRLCPTGVHLGSLEPSGLPRPTGDQDLRWYTFIDHDICLYI
jgi:hypothetical protein